MKFLITILLALCSTCFGADWYVDNEATGTANGASWANAWTNFETVNWSSISAGDTVFISGGSVSKSYTNIYSAFSVTNIFRTEKGGSEGSPITITVGRDAGHDGVVKLDAMNRNIDTVAYIGFDWITVDGGPNTNLWFINNLILDGSTDNRLSGKGYMGGTGSHQILTRCVFSNLNNGISWNGAYDVEVSSNRIVQIVGDGCVGLGTQYTNFGNYRFHHNLIQSILDNTDTTPSTRWGGPDGLAIMDGCDIWANEFVNTLGSGWTNGSGQHPDAIQTTGFMNYTRIWGNLFHTWYNSVLELDPISTNGHDIYVWNNLFKNDDTNIFGASHKVAEISGGGPLMSNIFIFNNTFVDWTGGAYPWGHEWSKDYVGKPQPSATNYAHWNNLWYNSGDAALLVWGTYPNTNWNSGSVDIAFNLFSGGSTNIIIGIQDASQYYYGFRNPVLDMPTFVNTNDYRLATGSPGIGDGTNLTTFMVAHGLSTADRDGNARPDTGAWDIGAYTFTVDESPGPDETSPSVSVTSPASTNAWHVTLTGTASDNVGVDHVTVTVNGVSLGNATGTTNWSMTVDLKEGANAIIATAYDAANNSDSDNVSVSFSPNQRKSVVGFRSSNGRFVSE